MKKESTQEDYKKKMTKVIEYIELHLDECISVEILAKIASFSHFHFHRVFLAMLGENLAEFCRRLRIERAASKLRYEQFSITELAYEAGYENLESFSRAFKKQYGMLPSLFRAQKVKEFKKKYFHNLGEMRMDVKIKKIDDRNVLACRHMGPYEKCATAWENLCRFAGPKGLLGPRTQYLGICYDDPEVTDPNNIRYDACITIDDNDVSLIDDTLRCHTINGGNFGCYIHKGPMEKLKDSYDKICGIWACQNNIEFSGAYSIEIYLNDPEKTKPEDLLIEIQCPVK